MSEEKEVSPPGFNIEEAVAKFITNPEDYSLEDANTFYRKWVAYEDKIEADAIAHAEKVKIVNRLTKSVNKHYGESRKEKIKANIKVAISKIKEKGGNIRQKIKKKE